jgi:protein-histidine N-methyltransferase
MSANVNSSSSGDFDVTDQILQQFVDDITAKGINIVVLSGPWSAQMCDLVPPSSPDLGSVILAAETIYSAESTTAFVEVLVPLLERVKMAKAMIAAKRMYFGVGGSVDGLKEACREKGAVAYEIENHGVPGMDSGVGRALVEVQMY